MPLYNTTIAARAVIDSLQRRSSAKKITTQWAFFFLHCSPAHPPALGTDQLVATLPRPKKSRLRSGRRPKALLSRGEPSGREGDSCSAAPAQPWLEPATRTAREPRCACSPKQRGRRWVSGPVCAPGLEKQSSDQRRFGPWATDAGRLFRDNGVSLRIHAQSIRSTHNGASALYAKLPANSYCPAWI